MRAKNDKRNRSPLKGILNRGPEQWCGIIKPSDGKPCRSPKVEGKDTCHFHENFSRDKPITDAIEAFLPGQKYELPPDLPLNNIDDAMAMLGHCINWVHQGKLPVSIGTAITKMVDTYAKLVVAKEKYSPDRIARREITRAQAMKFAQNLTDEQAKLIIQQRTAELVVVDILENANKTPTKTEEGLDMRKKAERGMQAMERLIDKEKAELADIIDVEELLQDSPEAKEEETQDESI